MRIPALALALVGLLAVAGAAEAATLKVPSDDHQTIQSALDAAATGDTVSIAAGTYTENLVLESATKVKIKGKKGVIVQPEGGIVLDISKCTDVTVQGLTLMGGSTGVVVDACTRVTLTKLVVDGSTGDGVQVTESDSTKVSKCDIRNVDSRGIRDSGSDDLVIDRNDLTTCGSDGLYLSPWQSSTDAGSNRARVTKNIVDGAPRGATLGGDDMIIDKNRFQNLTGDGIRFGTSTTISGSVVRRNVVSTSGGACVTLEGEDQRAEKNTLTGGQWGILSYGPRAVIKSNRLDTQTVDGIALNGDMATAEKNTIDDAGQDALVVRDTNHVVKKNKIRDAIRHGIHLLGTGHSLTSNKVTGSGGNGGLVEGTGNTLTKNKFSGSTGQDLLDTTGEGNNTYEKNKPDPSFPPPV